MSLFAKSAAGVVGVGGISVAGCYAMGVFDTKFDCLTEEKDWGTEYSDVSKVGKAYGYLLAGTYNEGNKKWWEKSYATYNEEQENSLSTEFKTSGSKVKLGFVNKTTGDSSLNKLCEIAYKKTLTDITQSASDTNKALLEKNLWKFCSPLGTKPVSLPEGGDSYQTTGTQDDKKSKLVSVKSQANDSFWVLKNKWFKNLNSDSMDNFFKSRKGKSIKDICKEAYGLEKVSDDQETKPKEENVIKYCSLQATVY